jgi:hypothetical protein
LVSSELAARAWSLSGSRSRTAAGKKTHVAGQPGLLASCDDLRDRAQTVAVITRYLVGYIMCVRVYIYLCAACRQRSSLSFLRR